MIAIRPATTADAATIQTLATSIWWPTYRPILADEQITYMLDKLYDLDTITRQIVQQEQSYIILLANGEPTGFAAYSPRTENQEIYKLHKLYCLTETKGKGYGKLLLQAVEQAVLLAGKNILDLNVNRYNPAIGFYEKMGFTVAYTEDIDIGGGYFMNDYVMRKQL